MGTEREWWSIQSKRWVLRVLADYDRTPVNLRMMLVTPIQSWPRARLHRINSQ